MDGSLFMLLANKYWLPVNEDEKVDAKRQLEDEKTNSDNQPR